MAQSQQSRHGTRASNTGCGGAFAVRAIRMVPAIMIMVSCLGLAGEGQSIGEPIQLSDRVGTDEAYMGVRLRGALRLRPVPGLDELSALAWDEDEQILYALSDNGRLLHLRPVLQGSQLIDVLLLRVLVLLDPRGKPLAGHSRDSEGLALENGANGIRGDSRLLISFERRNRIDRYTPDGYWDSKVALPPVLKARDTYRSRNEGLEAVTLHPEFGVLTGPEHFGDGRSIPIFDLRGSNWLYQPFEENGALVAMEALPDGSVVVLERAFTSPFSPWVITLSRVWPDSDNTGKVLPAERLVSFDSGEGWRTLNFEGLSAHQDGRFFMVSDDAGSSWQSTQLLYIELFPEPRP